MLFPENAAYAGGYDAKQKGMILVETLILNADDIETAADIIKNGGLVAIPTETVYGLAADALNGKAVSKIFKAKGRPSDNPLIIHIADTSQINMLVSDFPEKARTLAKKFWPGPLTVILPKSDLVPDEVSAGLDTVAVRCPSNITARQLIKLSSPLAAPSANRSGRPSPTNVQHVFDDMNGRIDAILNGGECDVGVESTVITLADSTPRLLRPGKITVEQLRETIGEVIVDDAVINPLGADKKAASPGMKYKHYSPKANVILLKGGRELFCKYVNKQVDKNAAVLCYDEEIENITIPYISVGRSNDYDTQARKLFSSLRKADEYGFKTVYAHCPGTEGEELAIYNRIIRAAGFEVTNLEG